MNHQEQQLNCAHVSAHPYLLEMIRFLSQCDSVPFLLYAFAFSTSELHFAMCHLHSTQTSDCKPPPGRRLFTLILMNTTRADETGGGVWFPLSDWKQLKAKVSRSVCGVWLSHVALQNKTFSQAVFVSQKPVKPNKDSCACCLCGKSKLKTSSFVLVVINTCVFSFKHPQWCETAGNKQISC